MMLMAFVNKWHAVSPGVPYTRCGIHLIEETVYDTRQPALTEQVNCRNCIRIVGVIGDGRNDLD